MFDFASHQILIFFAGLGLVGFGVVALLVSFFWPRKQLTAPAVVKNETRATDSKGGLVVSVVPPVSSAALSTSAGGTLLVSRREAFAKVERPAEEALEATASTVLTAEEPVSVASTPSASEPMAAARSDDLLLLEDLYAEMFALRSSIGELSRDIDTLRLRLEQSIEPVRAPSKRRDRSRNLQVQPAA